MTIVVEHQHTAGLALDLHPATDARRSSPRPAAMARWRDAQVQRSARDADRVGGIVPTPRGAERTRQVSPPERPAPVRRPTPTRPATARGSTPVGSAPRPAPSSINATRTIASRPVRQPTQQPAHPRVADIRDQGPRRSRRARAASPRTRRAPRASSANTSGWSHSAFSSDRHVRPVRVEVAGVLVRLDHERVATPPAGGRRQPTGDGGGQQGAHERARVRPAATSEQVDQPARRRWTCRACPLRPRAGRPG